MGNVLECQGERNFQNLEQCHEIQGEITTKTIYPIRYPYYIDEMSLKTKNNFEAQKIMVRSDSNNFEASQNYSYNYNSNDNIFKNKNKTKEKTNNDNKENSIIENNDDVLAIENKNTICKDNNYENNRNGKNSSIEKQNLMNNNMNNLLQNKEQQKIDNKNQDNKNISLKQGKNNNENNKKLGKEEVDKENIFQRKDIIKEKKENNDYSLNNKENINNNSKNIETILDNNKSTKNILTKYRSNNDLIKSLNNTNSFREKRINKNEKKIKNLKDNKNDKNNKNNNNNIIDMKKRKVNKSPDIKYKNHFLDEIENNNLKNKKYNNNNNKNMYKNQIYNRNNKNFELKDKKIITNFNEKNKYKYNNQKFLNNKKQNKNYKFDNIKTKNENINTEKENIIANSNKNKASICNNNINDFYFNNNKRALNNFNDYKRYSGNSKNINKNNFINNSKRYSGVLKRNNRESKLYNKRNIKNTDKEINLYELSKEEKKIFNSTKGKKSINQLDNRNSKQKMKKNYSCQNFISSPNTDSILNSKYKSNPFLEQNLYNIKMKNQIPVYRRLSPEDKQKNSNHKRLSYLSGRKNIFKSPRSVSGHKNYNFRDDLWTYFNKDSFLNTSKNRTIKNIDFNINTHLEHSNSVNNFNSLFLSNNNYNKRNHLGNTYNNSMNYNHDIIETNIFDKNENEEYLTAISKKKENHLQKKNKNNNNIKDFIKVRIPFNGTQICPILVNYSTNNIFILNYNNLNRINDSSILYDGNLYKVTNGQNGDTKLILRYIQITKNCFRYYNNIYSVLIYNEKPLVQFDIRYIQDVEIININLLNNVDLSKIKFAFSINLIKNSDFFIFATDDKEFGENILNVLNLLRKYYEHDINLFE